MLYRISISEEAREQLRALPDELRKNIGYRLHLLQQEFSGDIKKLEGPHSNYRLRVGGHRILFRIQRGIIEVYSVRQRKDAYD